MSERWRILHRRRPVLRVQLALLYAGVFIGLLVVPFLASAVLFGTSNVFFGHSASAYHPGAPSPAQGSGSRQFDLGPFLIAVGALGLAVLAAWWLAGRFLRPLRAMTSAAQEISATNLDRRLGLDGPQDELTELGRTLDGLFGRLQASFESQRQFIANASHELRTPLAGQRTLLQVALADPQADAATLRDTCEEALALSAHQERLIDALLTLATSERGIERFEPLDLGALTRAIVDGRRREAERAGIEVRAALAPVHVSGDASLVQSLVANLVDNAIRHNAAGGTVEVSTESAPTGARLAVGNSGPIVPADELERLFRPFTRLGPERVGTTGHGLGLAIVQAVAAAHGATIDARPRPDGGLDVRVSFAPAGHSPPARAPSARSQPG